MLSEEARDTLTELLPPILLIPDAMRVLKVSESTVRRLIWDGELDAYMIGVEWQINRASIIEYMALHSNF